MFASPVVPCEAVVRCSNGLWLRLVASLLVSCGGSGSGAGTELAVACGGGELIGHGVGDVAVSSAKFLNLSRCICKSSGGGAFTFGGLGGALAGRGESAVACFGVAAENGKSRTKKLRLFAVSSSDWVSKKLSASCPAMAGSLSCTLAGDML